MTDLRRDEASGAIEDAVGRYIDDLTAGKPLDPMEVLLENPGIGHEVLARLEEFVDLRQDDQVRTSLGTLGDYTLRRQIGRGGMGVVYDAWQNSLDRRVALKVLPAGIAADTKSSTRFLREAQIAAKLSHRQIVPVFASGVEGHTPYYAMEPVSRPILMVSTLSDRGSYGTICERLDESEVANEGSDETPNDIDGSMCRPGRGPLT